ncbi:hypothetical protein KIH39_00385 [Telmatocola sphagniphila]|uniref:NHL repeat-containing protein n=1 Tax=Telmatocola sphagniphila TaxID=1123043 RepID=A0A8E6BCS0_9BACT|nr:hypothetical protein [Telmatocola sphagniphila]QVL34803.1 hypothetical protein KIH39_00385 [Telmatocola sphagniphila]
MKILSLVGLLFVSVSMTSAGEGKISLLADQNLKEPFGGDFDSHGNYVLAEFGGHSIKSVSPAGKVMTIAGDGTKGYLDGPAEKARFNSPHNCVVHPKTGDIYVADTFNHTVRKIDAKSKLVTTVLGNGQAGYSGDGGPAVKATCNEAYHIALDSTGKLLYLADIRNYRIRQINLETGIVQTVVGNGKKGIPNNGTIALEAPLVDPRAVAVDGKGRLYILERAGNALRVVVDGKIETLVGKGSVGSNSAAVLNGPKFLWIEPNNNVLIADTENHCVRRFDVQSHALSLIAGTGKKGKGEPNGGPTQCALQRPHGVAITPAGELLISDTENNRILLIKK